MSKVHATCVAFADAGVLLFGESGSGKSDLALRLMSLGAQLIADDYTEITNDDGQLTGRVPPSLAGLLEVRGLGIVRISHSDSAPIVLAVDLVPTQAVERMPFPDSKVVEDVTLPLLRLDAFETSAAAKVAMAVRVAVGDAILME